MPPSGLAGSAVVQLVADTNRFNPEMVASGRLFSEETTKMEVLNRKLAGSYAKLGQATAKYGKDSRQATNALLGAKRAEEQLAASSGKLSHEQTRLGGSFRNAERDLGRLGRGALSGTGIMRGLGRSVAFASAAFLGGAGFIFALRGAIKAATDFDNALGQASAAVNANGESWNKLGPKIQKVIEEQSRLSQFTKTELLRSFTQLESATGSSSKALELNAVAMEVARRKHVDLATASNMVLKATLGGSRGMRALGLTAVTVTASVDALRASGQKYTHEQLRIAQAQDKAATITANLALVTDKYRGSLAKFNNSPAGVQARLNRVLEELRVNIGRLLLPIVEKYETAISNWIEKGHNQERVTKAVASAVKTASGVIGAIVGVLQKAAAVWDATAGKVLSVKDAVVAVGIAFAVFKGVKIITTLSNVTRAVGLLITQFKLVPVAATEAEIGVLAAEAGISASTLAMATAVKAALISTGIGAIAVGIGIAAELIITHWDTVKRWFSDFFGWIKNHVAIVAIFAPWLAITVEIIKHWNGVKTFFVGLGHFFANVFAHPIRRIQNLFTDLWSWLKKGAAKAALNLLEPFDISIWGHHLIPGLHGTVNTLKQIAGEGGAQMGKNATTGLTRNFKPGQMTTQFTRALRDMGGGDFTAADVGKKTSKAIVRAFNPRGMSVKFNATTAAMVASAPAKGAVIGGSLGASMVAAFTPYINSLFASFNAANAKAKASPFGTPNASIDTKAADAAIQSGSAFGPDGVQLKKQQAAVKRAIELGQAPLKLQLPLLRAEGPGGTLSQQAAAQKAIFDYFQKLLATPGLSKAQVASLLQLRNDAFSQWNSTLDQIKSDAQAKAQAASAKAKKVAEAIAKSYRHQESALTTALDHALTTKSTADERRVERKIIALYRKASTDKRLSQAMRDEFKKKLVDFPIKIHEDNVKARESVFKNIVEAAKRTSTTDDDIKAWTELAAFYNKEAHDSKLPKAIRDAFKAKLESAKTKLQQLRDAKAKSQTDVADVLAQISAEQAGFWASFAPNLFTQTTKPDGGTARSFGSQATTNQWAEQQAPAMRNPQAVRTVASQRPDSKNGPLTVNVYQTFPKPTANLHREARYALMAMKAAFDT